MNASAPDANYLTPGRVYEVIGLDHESFRVLDDKGEPILFPKALFSVIDDHIPEEWIWDRYSSEEFYANPPELHEAGFYEDFFDHKVEAVERFESFLRKNRITS